MFGGQRTGTGSLGWARFVAAVVGVSAVLFYGAERVLGDPRGRGVGPTRVAGGLSAGDVRWSKTWYWFPGLGAFRSGRCGCVRGSVLWRGAGPGGPARTGRPPHGGCWWTDRCGYS